MVGYFDFRKSHVGWMGEFSVQGGYQSLSSLLVRKEVTDCFSPRRWTANDSGPGCKKRVLRLVMERFWVQ